MFTKIKNWLIKILGGRLKSEIQVLEEEVERLKSELSTDRYIAVKTIIPEFKTIRVQGSFSCATLYDNSAEEELYKEELYKDLEYKLGKEIVKQGLVVVRTGYNIIEERKLIELEAKVVKMKGDINNDQC